MLTESERIAQESEIDRQVQGACYPSRTFPWRD
jgi:hypothetical protein